MSDSVCSAVSHRSMLDRITAAYGPSVLSKSAVRHADDRNFLEQVVSRPDVRTVLEIGTYRGCAAALMSQWCGKVITIDLEHGWLERDGKPFDRAAFWSSLGIDNIEFFRVPDEMRKAWLLSVLEFDLAFIDGEHDETVRRDFALVQRCGRVLFHDVNPAQPRKNAVYSFVRKLRIGRVSYHGNYAYWQA